MKIEKLLKKRRFKKDFDNFNIDVVWIMQDYTG